jgi:hypothetical protein
MGRMSHKMTGLTRCGAGAIVVFGLGGCSSMDSGSSQPSMSRPPVASTSMTNPKDGELPYPVGYMAWPKFLTDVQAGCEAGSGSLREQYRSND